MYYIYLSANKTTITITILKNNRYLLINISRILESTYYLLFGAVKIKIILLFTFFSVSLKLGKSFKGPLLSFRAVVKLAEFSPLSCSLQFYNVYSNIETKKSYCLHK